MSGTEIFRVTTFHKTQLFLDKNHKIAHKQFIDEEQAVFAERSESGVLLFVLVDNSANELIKNYIVGINADTTVTLSEEPSPIAGRINNADGSFSIGYGKKFWSARTNGLFAPMPRNLKWERFVLSANIPSAEAVWLEKMNVALENGCEFFATGGLQIASGFNEARIFKHKGVNLAAKQQSLRQSYDIARQIFERNHPVGVVLIGLQPDVWNADAADSDEPCDKILEDYIKLCSDHNAKPIGLLLPPHPSCIREQFESFRQAVRQHENSAGFSLIDLTEMSFGSAYFVDDAQLNLEGARAVSDVINFHLHDRGIVPFDEMRLYNYEYLQGLLPFIRSRTL